MKSLRLQPLGLLSPRGPHRGTMYFYLLLDRLEREAEPRMSGQKGLAPSNAPPHTRLSQ